MFHSVPSPRGVLATAILLSAVVGAGAHAQQSPALDRVSLAAGAFNAEPKVQASGDSTQYGHLDTDDQTLGHGTIPRIKADVLIGDSQGISLDYFRYDKDYNPSFTGQTNYNGQSVNGTATAQGNLKLELAQLAYRWWLGHGNDVFGVGVGGAYLNAHISASGTANVTGVGGLAQTQVSGSGETGDHVYAPLLEFGWRHAFANPDIRMYAEASGIKKNGGNVDGHIYGGSLGVEWFPLKQVGVVLDYSIEKIELNRSAHNEQIAVRLTGPSAYVKVRF
jgi:hypothetical protein